MPTSRADAADRVVTKGIRRSRRSRRDATGVGREPSRARPPGPGEPVRARRCMDRRDRRHAKVYHRTTTSIPPRRSAADRAAQPGPVGETAPSRPCGLEVRVRARRGQRRGRRREVLIARRRQVDPVLDGLLDVRIDGFGSSSGTSMPASRSSRPPRGSDSQRPGAVRGARVRRTRRLSEAIHLTTAISRPWSDRDQRVFATIADRSTSSVVGPAPGVRHDREPVVPRASGSTGTARTHRLRSGTPCRDVRKASPAPRLSCQGADLLPMRRRVVSSLLRDPTPHVLGTTGD